MYKRLGIRMLCVHSNSVELKVQHVLCHCYAVIHIFIKIFNIVLILSYTSLGQHWIFWSEWVPSERESKQLMKNCNNSHHSSPSINIHNGLWIFWTEEMVLNLNVLMDLFNTNMQLFTSLDVNWGTGVVWIIVMFLSAVWPLILTAPIHCRRSIGEQVI